MIDLTRRLDASLEIYADGDYRDPPLAVSSWCTIAERGFRVEALGLGTQTGTHVDAPAHFAPGGATIDAFPIADAIGRYCLVDLPGGADFRGEPVLFVRAPDAARAVIDRAALDALLALPPRIWIVAGTIELAAAPPLELHRALAGAGVFLVEDLDPVAARAVGPGGQVAVLPLALVGTGGAPCRVIVRPG